MPKRKYRINKLIYSYYKLPEWIAKNGTEYSFYERTEALCMDLIKDNIAIVSVKYATPRYIKTIMEKRFSIFDKISSFGKRAAFTKF